MNENRIDCYKCKYFYITWDRSFPRGCKAFGFKSRFFPVNVVKDASGMKCLGYEPKHSNTAPRDGCL